MSKNPNIDGLDPLTEHLVDQFAIVLKEKLRAAEKKHGFTIEWARNTNTWPLPECQEELMKHFLKGDPVDVAIFCAFLWHHHLPTVGNPALPSRSSMIDYLRKMVEVTKRTNQELLERVKKLEQEK